MMIDRDSDAGLYIATHKVNGWLQYTAAASTRISAMLNLYQLVLECEK